MRSRSLRSTSKHSGALMSSRLMPPKVGSSAATISTRRSISVSGDFDIEHVDPGEFLEENRLAFHHRFAGERANVAEAQNGGAVGDHRDEVLPDREFGRGAGIGGDREAGGGDAGRIGEREIMLRGKRLRRLDLEFAGARRTMVEERARRQIGA